MSDAAARSTVGKGRELHPDHFGDRMWELVDELHEIEKQQYDLGLRHAAVMLRWCWRRAG
ncbi:hypothetical protein GCM10010515_42480 [Streptomyces fructofermentans]|uniref:Uncharacterized protein n=1 Tax=Streptomyces fructofermentans TaxID=152141 RepID=A0A918KR30_9ACTN|nr:hypothetical protein GCM10010515_42480 [Streptomyces fructofermentans]